MSVRNKRVIAAVSVFTFMFCFFLMFKIGSSAFDSSLNGHEWEKTVHVVSSGETLWEISQVYCPENVDCRDWIDAVQELNGIDGYIFPGDRLTVLREGKK